MYCIALYAKGHSQVVLLFARSTVFTRANDFLPCVNRRVLLFHNLCLSNRAGRDSGSHFVTRTRFAAPKRR